MKLIVGLGNPGRDYAKTRHNAGFMCIDEVAWQLNAEVNTKKFKALIGQCKVNGENVILMKPQTFMNLSGEAVGECVRFYDIALEDIVVISDDLDLPIGKVRIREKGSSGGQKGLKSIIAHLGSQEFKRIRIGIGNDKQMLTADYVLGKISKADKELFDESVKKAALAAVDFLKEPFSIVMGKYNG